MDPPSVQYVKTSDGYDIAYSETGKGPPLVLLPQSLIDIRLAWHAFQPWLTALRDRFRLVQFDARGRGLSSRGLPANYTTKDMEIDLSAVVDKLDLSRLTLLANGGFGHLAVRYAANHPDRVKALIVANCSISMSAFPKSLFRDVSAENWDLFVQSLIPRTLSENEYRFWFESMRQASTPRDWQIEQRSVFHSDVSEELRKLQSPTLVIHARGFPFITPDDVRRLAAGIENARFESIDGRFMVSDPAEGLAAIDAFLAEVESPTARSRSAPSQLPEGLSQREVEVLRLLAAGQSNQQIADELVITRNTVRRHVSNIFDKTGLVNRAQAGVYARDNGIA